MSEHFDEQMSLFIDDEMTSEECEFFVRRLQRDDEARDCYRRYHLIGAVIRSEHLNLSRALAQRSPGAHTPAETGVDAVPPQVPGASSRAGLGLGMAAAVVLAVTLGIGFFYNAPELTEGTAADAERLAPADEFNPAYVADIQQGFPAAAEETGIQYLMHHTGYSSGVPRTIMRSSFVAAPQARIDQDAGVDPLE